MILIFMNLQIKHLHVYRLFINVFQEEGDGIYESEESDDEDTDSDISIDENDELKSDDEDESQKKKRRVVTKAYKVCLFYSKEKISFNFEFQLSFNDL